MEPRTPSLSPKHSSVDTSRPFSSVKEAVAVFGERLLNGELYAPKPYVTTSVSYDNPTYYNNHQETPRRSSHSSSPSIKTPSTTTDDQEDPKVEVLETLKKLEAELEETKMELKLLKERESETEIALATLNAELHKSKSKLAEAEAIAAAAAAKKVAVLDQARTGSCYIYDMGKGEEIAREEAKTRELMKRMEENNQTLAEILSISGEKEAYFGSRKEKKVGMKKKPIIPLVGDFLFFRKKNADHLQSIYSPAVYFN